MTEKLEITRYENGKIKALSRTVTKEVERDIGLAVADGFVIGDFYFSDPPKTADSISCREGPYVEFYENGVVSRLGVEGIYDLFCEKRFDSNGKVTVTLGKEEKFELTPEMQEILKKEKLLPAVEKALSSKKKPTLKSTLKAGTKKAPARKTRGKEKE